MKTTKYKSVAYHILVTMWYITINRHNLWNNTNHKSIIV